MCLIVLAWHARADLPLVVAANRDEWRDRAAQPAHWWPDHPELLAGRDLQAGGTWMGITRGGRFAAVTNFRDPAERRTTAKSRGGLVTEFLLGSDSPARFLSNLSARANDYNGFNLILGDGATLFYYGSREGVPRAIEPGVHGLSNHTLDEPWPKVVKGNLAMDSALQAGDPAPALFDMLSDAQGASDEVLPNTGVGIAWERRLASALITGPDYGTRASTVLTVAASGEAKFEERTRTADGSVSGIVSFACGLLLLGAAAVAQAQGSAVSDHVCVRNLEKWVSFRDPESVKVVSVSEGKPEVIDYANTRLVAVKFTVMVNSKGSQGGYTRPKAYECHTSEDRQRVLNYSPRND